jgi:hypothetical protein
MSFTVENVQTEAQYLLDETIDDANAVSWANMCVLAMGSRIWRETTKSYPDSVENRWYDLPTDFINSLHVRTTIGIPEDLAITQGGTPGTTHYSYAVTAVNSVGETLACTEVETTTGNATLNTTNYNTLTWTEVTGATSYNIYRTASAGTPSTTGYIGNATTETYNDDGDAGDSAVVPHEDSTEDEYASTSYIIRDRRIKFDDDDDYILTYTAYPTVYTAKTDTVALVDIFKSPMAKYMAARYLLYDSSDEASDVKMADRLMSEFYDDINLILGTVEIDNTPFQVVEVW